MNVTMFSKPSITFITSLSDFHYHIQTKFFVKIFAFRQLSSFHRACPLSAKVQMSIYVNNDVYADHFILIHLYRQFYVHFSSKIMSIFLRVEFRVAWPLWDIWPLRSESVLVQYEESLSSLIADSCPFQVNFCRTLRYFAKSWYCTMCLSTHLQRVKLEN